MRAIRPLSPPTYQSYYDGTDSDFPRLYFVVAEQVSTSRYIPTLDGELDEAFLGVQMYMPPLTPMT